MLVTPLLELWYGMADGILLVTLPLVIGVGLVLGLLVSDSSWLWHGEFAWTSAGVSDAFDSSSLDVIGRGMDRLFSILICCLPCSQLKAVSLYMMGSLGWRE